MIKSSQVLPKAISRDGRTVNINLECLTKQKHSFDCLIVLNCKNNQSSLRYGVTGCENIILADGGANYFYESSFRDDQHLKLVVGDLDSIKPQIQSYYRERKVQICKIYDQDHNDFQKSLMKAQQLNYQNCLCLGALGGRLDHTLSSLHIAAKYGRSSENMELILMGDGNLVIYLRPNIAYNIRLSQMIEKKGCGIVTLNKATNIQTKGYKWNLGAESGLQCLQWGSFISTSNQFVEDQVSIHSSDELYFVCCLKEQ